MGISARAGKLLTLPLLLTVISVIGLRLRGDNDGNGKDPTAANALVKITKGLQAFRFDTFGDEAFWGGKLRLHEPIAGEKHGGTGPGLTPWWV